MYFPSLPISCHHHFKQWASWLAGCWMVCLMLCGAGDAGGRGREDPEGGQLLRGEGGLPQRGRDDEEIRPQG